MEGRRREVRLLGILVSSRPSGGLAGAKFLCPWLQCGCGQLHSSLSSIHCCFPLNLQELLLATREPGPSLMVFWKPAWTFRKHPSLPPSGVSSVSTGVPVDTWCVHHVPQACICPDMLFLLTLSLVPHVAFHMQISALSYRSSPFQAILHS